MALSGPIRHWWLVFSAETKRLTAYRAQFWFELILSSIVELVVVVAVWRAVYESSGQSVLNGFGYQQMVLYLIVAVFFGQAAKGTGVGTFQREVYEGTFTKYLIYPLSIYSYKLGTYLPRALFGVGQLTLALFFLWALGDWPEEAKLSLSSVLLGLIALVFACLLYFFMIVCLEALSFWVDNIWTLSFALQIAVVFLSGKSIPINFFPEWAQVVLNSSPFPLMVYFPTQVFLGQVVPAEMLSGFLMSIFWIVALYLLSKVIISRGLHQYTGVGQ